MPKAGNRQGKGVNAHTEPCQWAGVSRAQERGKDGAKGSKVKGRTPEGPGPDQISGSKRQLYPEIV